MVNYEKLPPHLQQPMRRYVEDGIRPGHFLTGVLSNSLRSAVLVADDQTDLKELQQIVLWLIWEAPALSHGSETAVSAWAAKGGTNGIDARRVA